MVAKLHWVRPFPQQGYQDAEDARTVNFGITVPKVLAPTSSCSTPGTDDAGY